MLPPDPQPRMIRVDKLDLAGHVTRQYEGRLLQRDEHSVVLEAAFVIDKPDYRLLDVVLKRGDRFVETYYNDRGYNTYAIFDRDSAGFKGWYCNLSRPAHIAADVVTWVDLALDLWVWPDGRGAVLDEDEFRLLPISDAERAQVLQSLEQLKQHLEKTKPPS